MTKRSKHLLEANEISDEIKVSFKTRIITAIIGIAIVAPLVFLGDWFTFALIFVALFIGCFEIVRCAKNKYHFFLYGFVFVIALLLTYWPIFRGILYNVTSEDGGTWNLYSIFNEIYLSVIVLTIAGFILFFMVLANEEFTVRDATFLFTMLFFICIGLQSALFLRYLPQYNRYVSQEIAKPDSYFNFYDSFESSLLVVYVIISTYMTDTGAYIFGLLFGHKKVNERISPKKTWAGFFGGIGLSFIIGTAFALTMSLCDHPLINIFDLKTNPSYIVNILVLSLLLPVMATLGDFVFSSIKRSFNVKDFGKLLPGHGGILDRIDSLLFTFIFAAVYIEIVYLIVENKIFAI